MSRFLLLHACAPSLILAAIKGENLERPTTTTAGTADLISLPGHVPTAGSVGQQEESLGRFGQSNG